MRATAIRRSRAIPLLAMAMASLLAASVVAQQPAHDLLRQPSSATRRHPSALRPGQRSAVRAQQASAAQARQTSAAQAERPSPDLRIVRVGVSPSPLRDGQAATLTVMVHNDSPAVAVGSMVIELTHDRATALPLPPRHEVLYLGADGLAEVSFEVRSVSMEGSPYTFFATVDAGNEIAEVNEANNTTWARVSVCGDPSAAEVPDGYDNDCDGMIDEGLGLSADPVHALGRLRALQRQAEHDSALLIYATPRLFAPQPVEHDAWLASEEGGLIGLPPGSDAELSADFAEDAPGARLALTDWNGAELKSGDLISLRARGQPVVAAGGGGGRLVSRAEFGERERLFSIVRLAPADENGGPVATAPATPIESGDLVALAAWTGQFLSAEEGGGGRLRVDRDVTGGWESFTIRLEGSDDRP